MFLKFVPAFLVSASLLASPVLAQANQKSKSLDDDKIICKGVEETGSLLKKKKKCMTRKQWLALADATRDQALAGQMSGSASGQ